MLGTSDFNLWFMRYEFIYLCYRYQDLLFLVTMVHEIIVDLMLNSICVTDIRTYYFYAEV